MRRSYQPSKRMMRGWARVRQYATGFTLALGLAQLAACGGAPSVSTTSGQYSVRVADAAMQSGAPDMALRVAELMLQRDPRDVAGLIAKGDALYRLERSARAQAAYREALVIDPGAPGALVGLGRTLVRTDPRMAEGAFLKALDREPGNVAALNNLGITRDILGRRDEAQAAYRRALAVVPGMEDVQVNLGLSLALAGRSSEAVALLRPMADAASRAPWSRDLAAALTLAGDKEGAQLALEGRAAPEMVALSSRGGRLVATLPEEGPTPVAAVQTAPRTMIERQSLSAPTMAQQPLLATPPQPDHVPAAHGDATPAIDTPPQAPLAPVTTTRAAPARAVPAQPAPPRPTVTRTAEERARDHVIQLASLDQEGRAQAQWKRLTQRVPTVLASRTPQINRADINGRSYWRLRTGGFDTRQEAVSACKRVREAREDCWVL